MHWQAAMAAMNELYLQEMRYTAGEDPGPWIWKMQQAQQVFGYDDAHMMLLVGLCVKHSKAATALICQFSTRSSTIAQVYAGFRKFHELCKASVDSDKALKWAMLHVGCKGSHNLRNAAAVQLDKKKPPLCPTAESEPEICVTGEAEVLRFPEDSFPISCGYGDFCVNDVLKFDQTLVYNNMSMKEPGSVGKAYKRTIVGRVAHEADGVKITRSSNGRMSEIFSHTDEEATYTIEVYWSRGVKPVSTSEPFIIKVHSLELLKPVRQRWGNERNRVHEMEKKKKLLQGRPKLKATTHKSCRNPKTKMVERNGSNLVC